MRFSSLVNVSDTCVSLKTECFAQSFRTTASEVLLPTAPRHPERESRDPGGGRVGEPAPHLPNLLQCLLRGVAHAQTRIRRGELLQIGHRLAAGKLRVRF